MWVDAGTARALAAGTTAPGALASIGTAQAAGVSPVAVCLLAGATAIGAYAISADLSGLWVSRRGFQRLRIGADVFYLLLVCYLFALAGNLNWGPTDADGIPLDIGGGATALSFMQLSVYGIVILVLLAFVKMRRDTRATTDSARVARAWRRWEVLVVWPIVAAATAALAEGMNAVALAGLVLVVVLWGAIALSRSPSPESIRPLARFWVSRTVLLGGILIAVAQAKVLYDHIAELGHVSLVAAGGALATLGLVGLAPLVLAVCAIGHLRQSRDEGRRSGLQS